MDSLPMLAATAGAFLLAGLVKGVIGLGLPTVAIGLLGLLMTPAQAAAILVVPSLVTNIWQFAVGGELLALVRRLWPMLAGICIGTLIGAVLLPSGSSAQATVWLGVALAVYAGLGLIKVEFSVPPARRTVARLGCRHRDRRDHGGDRRVRAAGRALYPGAAVRARPAGAGARPVVHGVHRHAGRRIGLMPARCAWRWPGRRWWRSAWRSSACGLGNWCGAKCGKRRSGLCFFLGLLALGATSGAARAVVID